MIIDLSKYNRVTNWKSVSQNVEGAILRVGYRGYGSGKIVLDPSFETNAKMCYDYNIPVGLYFMSQAITVVEAIEEADFSLNYADKYGIQLPIFIDSEDGDGTARVVRADALNAHDRTEICKYFCKTVKDGGYESGTYASTSWFKNKLKVSELLPYKIWCAQYGPNLTATHRVDMWQYTSNGSVPGISGRVDLSKTIASSARPTIRKNDRGEYVKIIQRKVGTPVDGIFGPKTEAAVKAFQLRNGLIADGIVGKLTWAALDRV